VLDNKRKKLIPWLYFHDTRTLCYDYLYQLVVRFYRLIAIVNGFVYQQ